MKNPKHNRYIDNQDNSLWTIFRGEWHYYLTGSLISFFSASILLSGFPEGLIPNISIPYIYAGDGLSHSWMMQRVIEGWIFDNPRNGYPFGSDFRDYPGSDTGNLLLIKLLSTLDLGYAAVFNLYYLFSFSLVFLSTFFVSRFFGLNSIFAFLFGIAYSFSAFHFQRLPHIFYSSYFVTPLFFYISFKVFMRDNNKKLDNKKILLLFITMLILSSFGVYYALFGLIIFTTTFLTLILIKKSKNSLFIISFASLALILGVILNLLPNILNNIANGDNSEVAQRSPIESEIYGFKPVQLFLPQIGHRLNFLSKIAESYANSFPLVNENYTSNLNFLGSIGFLVIVLTLIRKIFVNNLEIKEGFLLLALIAITLFFFGIVGGGGSIFSTLISPSIRGWNRISIFILFLSLLFLFFYMQNYTQNFAPRNKKNKVTLILFLTTLIIIFFDQTKSTCYECNLHTKKAFESDKVFFKKIETLVGKDGAVYQLPYIAFPESPTVNGISSYDLLTGFLHTSSTRWSGGGMKGREGDLFYRSLAQKDVVDQIRIIKQLGFQGITIDRRAYADYGEELINQISNSLKYEPSIEHEYGGLVFFDLKNNIRVESSQKSFLDIVKDIK